MQLLSHYTPKHGFIGITRSRSLWATEFLALNDRTELVYALSAIREAALEQMLLSIPDDLRDRMKTDEDLGAPKIDALREYAERSDGYGSIFVTSFAQGRNEDEDERGILTLWDRYTRNNGYCLQFEIEHIRRLIQGEQTFHSYARIELAEVKYKINRQSSEFRWLVEQYMLRMLEFICRKTHDRRFEPDWDKKDPDTNYLTRLMRFCGTHKDPAFSDEREMRIFAFPLKFTDNTGFVTRTPKIIYCRENKPNGARYIVLGECILPGVIPNFIVIGPKAELLADTLDDLYPAPPSIRKSTIPIR